jgi:hypothetical protein
MVRLSGWVREQNAAGSTPTLRPDLAARVRVMPLPKLRERADKALAIVGREFPSLTDATITDNICSRPELLGATYSANPKEAEQLIHVLLLRGDLISTGTDFGYVVMLTAAGLLRIEEGLAKGAGASGFVAMNFDAALEDAWTNGFDPGIRAAGFRPLRIDAKDFVGGITDEIMAEIRVARFVVADYTGQRNGVYFEAGFALGLGLTVIATCHADEVQKLHFDIRHLNTLVWSNPTDLADRLATRIRAVIGTGPDMSSLTDELERCKQRS